MHNGRGKIRGKGTPGYKPPRRRPRVKRNFPTVRHATRPVDPYTGYKPPAKITNRPKRDRDNGRTSEPMDWRAIKRATERLRGLASEPSFHSQVYECEIDWPEWANRVMAEVDVLNTAVFPLETMKVGGENGDGTDKEPF